MNSLQAGRDAFTVMSDQGEYRAPAVIVASGKVPRSLNVPGESGIRGRGVAYCATCDGPLFAHKDVAVVGSGNAGLDAALQTLPVSPTIFTSLTPSRNARGMKRRGSWS